MSETSIFDEQVLVSAESKIGNLLAGLVQEIDRQDAKHGPFEGTVLGRSRLALACLQDECDEAKQAWDEEKDLGRSKVRVVETGRERGGWVETRTEVMQVAAVAIRALRDAL